MINPIKSENQNSIEIDNLLCNKRFLKLVSFYYDKISKFRFSFNHFEALLTSFYNKKKDKFIDEDFFFVLICRIIVFMKH